MDSPFGQMSAMDMLRAQSAAFPQQPQQPAPMTGMAPMTAMAPMFPGLPQGFGPPQGANFNVTAASGNKAKNYTPVSVNMTNVPMPSMFGALGLPTAINPFTVQAAHGTKASNYVPTSISMNAPSPIGLDRMQQILMMLQNTRSQGLFGNNGQG